MEDLVLIKFDPRVTRVQIITNEGIEEYHLSLPPKVFPTKDRIEEPDMRIITSERGTAWVRQLTLGAQMSILYNVGAWIKHFTKATPLENAIRNFLKCRGAWGVEETPMWLVSILQTLKELYPDDVLILEQKRSSDNLGVSEHLVSKTWKVAKDVNFSSDLAVKYLEADSPFLAFSELEGSRAFVVTKEGALVFRADPFPSVGWVSVGDALEHLKRWGRFYAFLRVNESDVRLLEGTFSAWVELLAEPYVDVAREVLGSFSGEVNKYVVSLFLRRSEGARVRAIGGPVSRVRPFESMLKVLLGLGAENLSGLFASFLVKLPVRDEFERESAKAFLKWFVK
ncbi:hypothetical protein [Thermococcus prieurii]